MTILSEIEKAMFEFEEIAVENETETDCIICRWYYTASDEEIARCHYCGLTEKMPCYGLTEKMPCFIDY